MLSTQQMLNEPYTWLGSEAPWLGLNGRLWGHRRLPFWGPPAASSPSNLRKLGQELLLHIFGMNPGLLLLPRKVGGKKGTASLLLFQILFPPCEESSPSPCPKPHREQLGPGFFTAMASTRAS